MAGSSNYSEDGPVAAINVTPLVDVMLVLLVIFMVTAPMMQQGVEVDLPKATTAPLKGSTEQVVLSIDKQGNAFLGAGNPVDVSTLVAKVKAIMDIRKEEDRKIYIKADAGAYYGKIMEIMGKIHEAGVFQIGLVSGLPDSTENKKADGKGA